MIGFEMEATGSNGFRRSSGAWTEGSMIALKIVLSAPKVNPPGMGGTRRGMIGSIEASFSKIAKSLLDRVCALGKDFTLFLKGDISLRHHFDYSKSSDQVKSEFLHALATAHGEIGDQVMIHLCRTIEDFIIMNLTSNDKLTLTVDIDL
jgi:hypothetical protein